MYIIVYIIVYHNIMLLLCVNENIIKIMFRMMISKYRLLTFLERPSGRALRARFGREKKNFLKIERIRLLPMDKLFPFSGEKRWCPGKTEKWLYRGSLIYCIWYYNVKVISKTHHRIFNVSLFLWIQKHHISFLEPILGG